MSFKISLEQVAKLFGDTRGVLRSSPDFKVVQDKSDGHYTVHLRRKLKTHGPSVSGICADYNDFWPSYYHAPTAGYFWRKYCYRKIVFTFDPTDNSISALHVYRVTAGDVTGAEVVSFWFTPNGAYVPELLTVFTDPNVPPTDTPFHIEMLISFEREVQSNQSTNPNQRAPLGTETDSIPFVERICWSPL